MTKAHPDKPVGTDFAQGAARFAELAQQVKARQLAASGGTARPSQHPLRIASPDEQWARNFASQGFGPSGVETVAARAPVRHARAFAPDLSALRPMTKTSVFEKVELAPPGQPIAAGAPMDLAFRPQAPVRRSFLKRLFGRG